jgi:peptidase U32
MSFKPSFSIGFNGSLSDLEQILQTNAAIESLYSGGLHGIIAGGRPQYADSINKIKQCIDLAHENNILYEIALNSPCGLHEHSDTDWWNSILDYLKLLEDCGTDRIIASHPFIIDIVKSKTKMQVVASTICEINEGRMAEYYENIGADIIIPSMNINFKLNKLAEIKSMLKHAKIRIMLNEHCLGDCPWRRFHHSHYAHSNQEYDYHINCKKLFMKAPYLILTNNCIRPEDINQYQNITDNFKIVGRLVDIKKLCKRIVAYEEQSFDENYVDLCDEGLANVSYIANKKLTDLFIHKSTCQFDCKKCGYCEKLYLSSATL